MREGEGVDDVDNVEDRTRAGRLVEIGGLMRRCPPVAIVPTPPLLSITQYWPYRLQTCRS